LLFVHDDVYIHDNFVRYRLNEAIARFDVIGLAGNKTPDFRQPSWALKFDEEGSYAGWQDKGNLSGAVSHTPDGGAVSFYGEMPAACELLDGLFLAVNTEKLVQVGAKFDPQFQFHFYDLDFCRACRQKGLSLGTWPIAVTHASGGSFGSPQWQGSRLLYKEKWQ
jgi:GT2 family glycosyltransferase